MSKFNLKSFWAGFFGLMLFPAWAMAVFPYEDNNRPLVRPADDFEYADTTSGPLQNGWVVKAGTGTANAKIEKSTKKVNRSGNGLDFFDFCAILPSVRE